MIVFYKAIEKKRKKERKKERRNRVNYFFYTNILFHILITLTQHTVSEYLTILMIFQGSVGTINFTIIYINTV